MKGRYRDNVEPHLLENGDYTKWSHELDPSGTWYAQCPIGLTANLAGHTITVHEDQTISVWPSIWVSGCDDSGKKTDWHGYLEKGVWRTHT